jgi:hypothetical protein
MIAAATVANFPLVAQSVTRASSSRMLAGW